MPVNRKQLNVEKTLNISYIRYYRQNQSEKANL